MTINKQIENGPYKLEIIIQSRTIHAHSMMTDYKTDIEDELGNMALMINSCIKEHFREGKR